MNDQPEKKGEELEAEPVEVEGEDGEELREISAEELDSILAIHSIWVASEGREGSRADLSKARLTEADLSLARLVKANLSGSDLSKANLSKALLSSAKLSGANLLGANLGGAMLDQADLQGAILLRANLQGAFLDKADLRGAFLGRADLRGAVLWKAKLKNASMFKASLERLEVTEGGDPGQDLPAADLTGIELRNADLTDALLSDVTGLQAENLAGTNLSNAKLPPDIAKFDALAHVAEISKHARNIFLAVVGACVYSWLTIATTTDLALITGSAATPLPIIQTPVSIAGFYWAAPPILFVLYVYLHLYLQRMWEGMAELPAIFPDGRTLDKRVYPWLLSGLVAANVSKLKDRRPPMSWLQVALSITAAWGLVPFTLFLFWGRYLVRHDWPWTLWHVLLFVMAAAFGLASYRLAKATLHGEQTERQGIIGSGARPSWREMLQGFWRFEHRWVFATGTVALLLSLGAIEGASNGDYRDWRSWLPSPSSLLGDLGFRGNANLREADVSTKPTNWTGLAERSKKQLEEDPKLLEVANAELLRVKGAALEGANLRAANARRAFFAKSDLEEANLQGADLAGANLQQAILLGANLQQAILFGANLQGADLRNANLQEADLQGANLQETRLGRANLQAANLGSVNLQEANLILANLQEADLRNANLQEADLRNANLQEARLGRANLRAANLRNANLQAAVVFFADLQAARLDHANLQEAILQGTNLRQANLERADLQRTNLVGAKLEGAHLGEANLREAKLGEADLERADLRLADLQKAFLFGANLQEADLRRAEFQEADLRYANLRDAKLNFANLRDTKNLTQAQLDTACGDASTKLPPGLTIKPCPEESTE